MKFRCPLCGRKIECDDLWAGEKTDCPACGGDINIPVTPNDDGKQTAHKIIYDLAPSIMIQGKYAFREADQFLRKSTNLRERLFSFRNTDGSFKTPLLASILYYTSMIMATLLCIAIAVIIIVALLLERIAEGVPTTIFYIIIAVITDIIFSLGVAQVIYAVCKICYHAERIDEQMNKDKK